MPYSCAACGKNVSDIDAVRTPSAKPAAVPGALAATACALVATLSAVLFTYMAYCLACDAVAAMSQREGAWLAVIAPGVLAAAAFVGGWRWTTLFVLSHVAFYRTRRATRTAPAECPPVSLFVPAYNEAENIEPALQAIVKLDYPCFEVMVVDDGSTDDTFERASKYAGQHDRCKVHVYRKPNGGKWSAHNFAFRRSRAELILCLDADSRVDPDALRRMVVHMADPQVAAVAGQIRVRNRINTLTRLQAMEYLMGNGCARMAMSVNGAVLIVAGPLGLFRRCVLEEVFLQYGRASRPLAEGQVDGPFEGDTFAEDFDLSMAVLSLGGRILYEPAAVCRTRAPAWPQDLLSQRYRWCRGTIQVLRKYFRRARSRPEVRQPRVILWLAATYLLDMALLPVLYVSGLALLILLLSTEAHGLALLGWGAGVLLLNLAAAAMFALIQGDNLALLSILPLYDAYQNFLLTTAWLISIVDEIRGASMRW